MSPTLFVIFGVQIGSYGVSKALAAWWLLSREFRRTGWHRDVAATLVMATTLVGFLGAKLYYLAEHAATLTVHDFGSSGFTWYGGFLAGAATFVVLARRHRLPLAPLAAVSAAPISVAYGIGRLGCLLAGDGTYGRPSNLPGAMDPSIRIIGAQATRLRHGRISSHHASHLGVGAHRSGHAGMALHLPRHGRIIECVGGGCPRSHETSGRNCKSDSD